MIVPNPNVLNIALLKAGLSKNKQTNKKQKTIKQQKKENTGN